MMMLGKLQCQGVVLKIICQEKSKKINFCSNDNRYKENHAAENRIKNSCSLKNYLILIFVEAFFVHELPPLVFKRFSTTLHCSVMIQMLLAFINTV